MQNGSLIFWGLICLYRGSSVFAQKQVCVHTTDTSIFRYLVFTGVTWGMQDIQKAGQDIQKAGQDLRKTGS